MMTYRSLNDYIIEILLDKYESSSQEYELHSETFRYDYTKKKLFGLVKETIFGYGVNLNHNEIVLRQWLPCAPRIICFFESPVIKDIPMETHEFLLRNLNINSIAKSQEVVTWKHYPSYDKCLKKIGGTYYLRY